MVLGIGDSAARPVGREHIPDYPKYFFGLRIAQLVVGLIILGLDAYGLSVISFSGDELTMFTAIATLIVCIYYLVADLAAPAAFNYWAVLSLDGLMVIFWLSSFALLASQVAPAMKHYSYCTYAGYCYNYGLTGADRVYADCLAAAAGLGGLAFLLFAATVTVNGLALHNHRAHGLHSVQGQPATVPGSSGDDNAAEKAAAAAAGGVPLQQPVAGGGVAAQQQQVPYYEQQAAAAAAAGYPAGTYASVSSVSPDQLQQQQQQHQQFYAAQTMTPPPPQQPTPVPYGQPPVDPNNAAYYAALQQQQYQQQLLLQQQQQPQVPVPQQQVPVQQQVSVQQQQVPVEQQQQQPPAAAAQYHEAAAAPVQPQQ